MIVEYILDYYGNPERTEPLVYLPANAPRKDKEATRIRVKVFLPNVNFGIDGQAEAEGKEVADEA